MPIDYSRYGEGWRKFSDFIRFDRAHGRCECTGECGIHQPNPRTRRCEERHHTKALWARGIVRLTVAHICQCDPPCQNPSHVIAACQRCHLRIDRWLHAKHRACRKSGAPP